MLQARPDQVLTLILAQRLAALGENDVGPQAVPLAEQKSSRERNALPDRLPAQEDLKHAEGVDHGLPL